MSKKSRLPVVMLGRDVANLVANFPKALASVLLRLGFSADAIEREIRESCDIIIAATDSRSMLGSLNDFAMLVQYRLREEPVDDLIELSLWLANTLVAPLGYRYPREVAEELLG